MLQFTACPWPRARAGLAQSLPRQRAAVDGRPSQQAQQPDGSFAKRALRAAAAPVSDTADHGRHSAASRRRRSAGLPGAEPDKGPVKKADREVRPPGDVRAPGHDHCAEYSSFVDQ